QIVGTGRSIPAPAFVQPTMKRALCLVLFWLAATLPSFASGLIIIHDHDFWMPDPRHPHRPIIIPPPTHPPPPVVWAPLETSFTKADIRIKDQLATTTIEQEFYNPNSRQLEGTFLFPVPKGAQINKFTMEI